MKRSILVIVATLVFSFGFIANAAAYSTAADLISWNNEIVTSDMLINSGPQNTPIMWNWWNADDRGGKTWTTDIDKDCTFIDINMLSSEYTHIGIDKTVSVTVTYFDYYLRQAEFAIVYDSYDNVRIQETESVVATGSNSWKDYTFVIHDARFDDGIDNGAADFRILLKNNVNIAFSRIEVTITDKTMDAYLGNLPLINRGNIFIGDQVTDYSFDIFNTKNTDNDITYTYQITTANNVPIKTGGYVQSFSAGERRTESINVASLPYGVYRLSVSVVGDDGNNFSRKIGFSKIVQTSELNNRFGSGAGDALSPVFIKNAGMGLIRVDVQWDRVEQTEGILAIPAEIDEAVRSYADMGLEVVILLAYGNVLYDKMPTNPTRADNPVTDRGREGFARYAAFVAEHFKGIVRYYEVWNEWDNYAAREAPFNPSGYDYTYYVKLLQQVYPALKATDAEIKVCAGAASFVTGDWNWMVNMLSGEDRYPINPDSYAISGTLDSGVRGIDFCDIVSIHPYNLIFDHETAQSYIDDLGSTQNAAQAGDLRSLIDELGSGRNIELWMTEVGIATSPDDTSSSVLPKQYDYDWSPSKNYILGLASGIYDRIIIYTTVNPGIDINYGEDNFGLVLNRDDPVMKFGAKPSYVGIANTNNLLNGLNYVNSFQINASCIAYRFENDLRTVYAVWRTGSSSRTVTLPEANGSYITDLYGNRRPYSREVTVNRSITFAVVEKGAHIWIEGADGSQITQAEYGEPFVIRGLNQKESLLCLAVYDSTGKLIDCRITAFMSGASLENCIINAGSRAKAFLWEIGSQSPEGYINVYEEK